MLSKATLLTAIELATFASAVNTGVSIPLRKRGSLTRDDGVFDRSKAIFDLTNVQNKYRQNLSNPVQNGTATATSKRQKEDLTAHDDVMWAGTITIGSDNQEFVVIIDSELSPQCLLTPLLQIIDRN